MELLSTLHVATVFVSFGIILLADKQAFGWLRGAQKTLNAKRLHTYHLMTWACLLTLIISGFFLFLPRASYLIHEPLFLMKMLFVGILVTNAVLIGRLMPVATVRPFRDLTDKEVIPLLASGAFSMLGWIGAVVVAVSIF